MTPLKREAATHLINVAGGVSGAYDALSWFKDDGSYCGPKEEAPRGPTGAHTEASAHFREISADYDRRNLTLQGREMALRDEIQTAQYQFEEYAAMAATQEDYLDMLRHELVIVGEAIDTERAEAITERDQRFLSMCHEMGPQFDSIDEMVSVLRAFERESCNGAVRS